MNPPYKILIFGASYGSLLATKLGLAGHSAHLICLPAEAELINQEGARVRFGVVETVRNVRIQPRDTGVGTAAGAFIGGIAGSHASVIERLGAVWAPAFREGLALFVAQP